MTLTTGGRRRTVVGVMPPGFTVTGWKADYLLPYGLTMEQFRAARGRGSSYAIARLREDVSLPQAASDMRAIAVQLEKEAPQRNAGTALVLTIVATLASYLPARRGMRIAPADALRAK